MTTNGMKFVKLSALYLFAFNKAPPYIPKIVNTVKTAKKVTKKHDLKKKNVRNK